MQKPHKQQLQQLTLLIDDAENLLDEVSEIAYDKAVEVVSNIIKIAQNRLSKKPELLFWKN